MNCRNLFATLWVLCWTNACLASGWTSVSGPQVARSGHTATLLMDGKVLVVGGNGTSSAVSLTEMYDPQLDQWTTVGALSAPRTGHTATLLASGEVLITGGATATGSLDATTGISEKYNPQTRLWTKIESLKRPRIGHTVTALRDGRVLVAGGTNFAGNRVVYDLNEAELFDPVTNTWTFAGNLLQARGEHSATLLPSGEVLIAGGTAGRPLATVEAFSPATNTWRSVAPLSTSRLRHTATLQGDGTVLVVGGTFDFVAGATSSEKYDGLRDLWSDAGSTRSTRYWHSSSRMPSGEIFSVGGISGDTPSAIEPTASAEAYILRSDVSTSRAPMSTIYGLHTATLLSDGRLLVISRRRAEIYSETLAANPGTVDPVYGIGGRAFAKLSTSRGWVTAAGQDRSSKVSIVSSVCGATLKQYCLTRFDQTGAVDESFGAGRGVSGDDIAVNSVQIRVDGKVLVSGICTSTSICVARHNSNGTLDNGFGVAGVVKADTGRTWASAHIALLADGRVAIGGACRIGSGDWSLCSLRLDANGLRDPTYSTGLVAMLNLGMPSAKSQSVALTSKGSLLVTGVCGRKHSNPSFVVADHTSCVAQFAASGAIDTSFGLGGLAVATFADGFSTIIGLGYESQTGLSNAGVMLQDDGKIIAANRCVNDVAQREAICITRWLSNGAPDLNFGSQAHSTITMPAAFVTFTLSHMAVQSDGKVVVVSRCYDEVSGFADQVCAQRVNSDGSLDTGFRNALGAPFRAVRVIASSEDRLLFVGNCDPNYSRPDLCIFQIFGSTQENMETRRMVEYRYVPLDYYFITSRTNEQAILNGASGWSPTGESFAVSTAPASDRRGITRFYFDQIALGGSRGSHFYTLLASEVAAVQSLNPTNRPDPGKPVSEGIDGYAAIPRSDGACDSGTVTVYRLFRGNSRFPDDPNHRFTTNRGIYEQFVARGWDGEEAKLCALP